MAEKAWEVKATLKENGTLNITSTNQGFSVFELLGIVKVIEKSIIDFLPKGQFEETLFCNDKELRKGSDCNG